MQIFVRFFSINNQQWTINKGFVTGLAPTHRARTNLQCRTKLTRTPCALCIVHSFDMCKFCDKYHFLFAYMQFFYYLCSEKRKETYYGKREDTRRTVGLFAI